MAHSGQTSSWISRTCLRAPTVAGLAILLITVMLASPTAQSQTYTLLYSLRGGKDGSFPYGKLARDAKGNLYGTTSEGGIAEGTVFRIAAAGEGAVLYRFEAKPDGRMPRAGLVADTAGNGYGTTLEGGTEGYGTIYKLDHRTAKETVLHSFAAIGDGKFPYAGLTVDAANTFYGTTSSGGESFSCKCGTVFRMDAAGNETILYNFAGGTDGMAPDGGLILDAAGSVYGTTSSGGAHGAGTIFRVDTSGKETVLYSFTGGTDGSGPDAGLVWDSVGNLYGTAPLGGDLNCPSGPQLGCGTVFKFNPTTGSFSVLHSFTGPPDGDTPVGGVAVDVSGDVYGNSVFGGAFGQGAVFEVNAAGVETVVYSFSENGGEGAGPRGGLILDAAGNLYGTAGGGGEYNAGVVFEITP